MIPTEHSSIEPILTRIDSSSTRYMLPNYSSAPINTDLFQNTNIDVNNHPMITRSKTGITKHKLPFAGTVATTSVPTSVTKALTSPTWFEAMKAKFQALKHNVHGP